MTKSLRHYDRTIIKAYVTITKDLWNLKSLALYVKSNTELTLTVPLNKMLHLLTCST